MKITTIKGTIEEICFAIIFLTAIIHMNYAAKYVQLRDTERFELEPMRDHPRINKVKSTYYENLILNYESEQ